MTILYPVIPEDKRVFILVEKGQCIVARFIEIAPYEYEIERAANWLDLEPDAHQAVQDFTGAITRDDLFPCPEALVARAVWDT